MTGEFHVQLTISTRENVKPAGERALLSKVYRPAIPQWFRPHQVGLAGGLPGFRSQEAPGTFCGLRSPGKPRSAVIAIPHRATVPCSH